MSCRGGGLRDYLGQRSPLCHCCLALNTPWPALCVCWGVGGCPSQPQPPHSSHEHTRPRSSPGPHRGGGRGPWGGYSSTRRSSRTRRQDFPFMMPAFSFQCGFGPSSPNGPTPDAPNGSGLKAGDGWCQSESESRSSLRWDPPPPLRIVQVLQVDYSLTGYGAGRRAELVLFSRMFQGTRYKPRSKT